MISKQGDRYLRMLLIHGARSVLRAAAAAHARGRPLDGLQAWAVTLQHRTNHNKAACALATKMAHIAYACPRDHVPYGEPVRLNKKIDRQSFAMPIGSTTVFNSPLCRRRVPRFESMVSTKV